MDTIGTSKLVLLMEVSFVEGSFNIIVKMGSRVSFIRVHYSRVMNRQL